MDFNGQEYFVFPLSFAQRRLWVLDQLLPNNPAYNLPLAIRLEGPLDRRALERCLNEIVRRHETLRTTFAMAEEEPVQIIASFLTLPLMLVDLQGLSEEEQRNAIPRLMRTEVQRPFDLVRGPLLRAVLVWLDENVHLLLLTMHHIITDGWSLGLFSRELTAIYPAFAAGLPCPLPDLPIQYADFALWQRDWLQDDALEGQLAYWRKQLAGAPAVLALPTDRPRPPEQTFEGARQTLFL